MLADLAQRFPRDATNLSTICFVCQDRRKVPKLQGRLAEAKHYDALQLQGRLAHNVGKTSYCSHRG